MLNRPSLFKLQLQIRCLVSSSSFHILLFQCQRKYVVRHLCLYILSSWLHVQPNKFISETNCANVVSASLLLKLIISFSSSLNFSTLEGIQHFRCSQPLTKRWAGPVHQRWQPGAAPFLNGKSRLTDSPGAPCSQHRAGRTRESQRGASSAEQRQREPSNTCKCTCISSLWNNLQEESFSGKVRKGKRRRGKGCLRFTKTKKKKKTFWEQNGRQPPII